MRLLRTLCKRTAEIIMNNNVVNNVSGDVFQWPLQINNSPVSQKFGKRRRSMDLEREYNSTNHPTPSITELSELMSNTLIIERSMVGAPSEALHAKFGPEFMQEKIKKEFLEQDVAIGLNDSLELVMLKICKGNSDAVRALLEIKTNAIWIDPTCPESNMWYMLQLDVFRIYGKHIWALYHDVCNENITLMLAVLRSCQLGLVKIEEIYSAILNEGLGIRGHVSDILNSLRLHLPGFGVLHFHNNQ